MIKCMSATYYNGQFELVPFFHLTETEEGMPKRLDNGYASFGTLALDLNLPLDKVEYMYQEPEGYAKALKKEALGRDGFVDGILYHPLSKEMVQADKEFRILGDKAIWLHIENMTYKASQENTMHILGRYPDSSLVMLKEGATITLYYGEEKTKKDFTTVRIQNPNTGLKTLHLVEADR